MKLLPWLIIIMAMMALILFAADQVNQSAAERSHARAAAIRARADVIRAQGQARIDATAAFLPYVIVGVASAFGAGVIVIGLVILARPGPAPPPERLIERQVIIVIAPPDLPRRQMWRQLSERVQTR